MAKQAAESRAAGQHDDERWTEQDARRILDAWEKSGETVAAFARRIGVIPQRLFWWRRRLGRSTSGASSIAFVPVTVRPAAESASGAPSAPVVVTLGERVHIDVRQMDATTAAWIATLLLHLGEARPCS